MNQYVVYSIHTMPSKKKGELPNIIREYISLESDIGWHYSVTTFRARAYVFEEFELPFANEIADFWRMKVEKLN